MIVSAINSTEQIKYPRFKGNVSDTMAMLIRDGIRNDCLFYSEMMIRNGETVNKSNLENIKNIWVNLWQVLKEKAALMHKDTTINVQRTTEGTGLGSKRIFKYGLIIKNNKLDETLTFPNMYNSDEQDIVQYKKLENFTNNFCPKDTDKELLKKAAYKLLGESYKGNLYFLQQRYEKLMEYKKEIGLDERIDVMERLNLNIKKLSDQQFMENMLNQSRAETSDIINELLKDIK